MSKSKNAPKAAPKDPDVKKRNVACGTLGGVELPDSEFQPGVKIPRGIKPEFPPSEPEGASGGEADDR